MILLKTDIKDEQLLHVHEADGSPHWLSAIPEGDSNSADVSRQDTHTHTLMPRGLWISMSTVLQRLQLESQTHRLDSAHSFPGAQRKTEMKKSVKQSSLTEPCQSAAVPTLIIDWMIRADEEIFFWKRGLWLCIPHAATEPAQVSDGAIDTFNHVEERFCQSRYSEVIRIES